MAITSEQIFVICLAGFVICLAGFVVVGIGLYCILKKLDTIHDELRVVSIRCMDLYDQLLDLREQLPYEFDTLHDLIEEVDEATFQMLKDDYNEKIAERVRAGADQDGDELQAWQMMTVENGEVKVEEGVKSDLVSVDEEDEDDIHLITPVQYYLVNNDHAMYELEYNPEKDELRYQYDYMRWLVIDNVEELIGDGLRFFGVYPATEDTVYVRNNKLKVDFAIRKVSGDE